MSYVYLIAESDNGPVKIGVAKNPGARIVELQVGNPKRLRLAGTWALLNRNDAFFVERAVLDEMVRYRLVGEWIDARVSEMKLVISSHVREAHFS